MDKVTHDTLHELKNIAQAVALAAHVLASTTKKLDKVCNKLVEKEENKDG